ncbi:MAG: hypothetical protein OEY49_03090 [Candidatus Heimdallarchaeota archaeon]|nr:hypothetical protein [Candidatus Heimdallarchaeota archaeon]
MIDITISIIWFLITLLLILNLQFIIHELGHIHKTPFNSDRKYYFEYQGPFGVRISKTKEGETSITDQIKALEAPYIGLFGFLITLISIIQIWLTIILSSYLTTTWIIFVFISIFWLKYLCDTCVLLLIHLWKITTPRFIKIAKILSIPVSTDILVIAHLKGEKIYENFDLNDDGYIAIIEEKMENNLLTIIHQSKHITYYRH